MRANGAPNSFILLLSALCSRFALEEELLNFRRKCFVVRVPPDVRNEEISHPPSASEGIAQKR